MHNKNKIRYSLFIISFIFAGISIGALNSNMLTLQSAKATENNESEVLFEGVGNYAFAMAGNNNWYRGTSFYAGNGRAIKVDDNTQLPENWANIKQSIEREGFEITNLSGSKLNAEGEIVYSTVVNICHSGNYNYKIDPNKEIQFILINPSGKYKIYECGNDQQISVNNDTDFVNESGWYWGTFINSQAAQMSWSITAVYKTTSDNTPSYIKLVYDGAAISNDPSRGLASSKEINFYNPLDTNGKVQLVGTLLWAGTAGWPTSITNDKAYALLEGGAKKQLYETSYGGKTIFTGRTSNDFANGSFSTVRSHNLSGGELDIFDETIGYDFFDNKEIVGYLFEKNGRDVYAPVLFGLRKTVNYPEFATTSSLNDNNPNSLRITVKNDSDYNVCNGTVTLPIRNLGKVKKVEITPNKGVSYNIISDDTMIVKFDGLVKSGSSYNINIEMSANEPTSVILNPVTTYYPAAGEICSEEITSNDNLKLETKEFYAAYRVVVRYIDSNNNDISSKTITYIKDGAAYNIEPKQIKGFKLTSSKDTKGVVNKKEVSASHTYMVDNDEDENGDSAIIDGGESNSSKKSAPNTGMNSSNEAANSRAIYISIVPIFLGILFLFSGWKRNKKVNFD